MNLSIISIGNELLNGRTINTNASFLGKSFSPYDIKIKRVLAIADTPNDIITALDQCKADSELIICSGGLGPTNDDITKKVVADYFNLEMIYNDNEYERIKKLFQERGRKILHLNKDQTLYPKASKLFVNDIGTASSFMIESEQSQFFFFPGVPSELKHLIRDKVLPYLLKNRIRKHDIFTQVYKTIFYPESQLYNDLLHIIEESKLDFAFYPNYGLVDVIVKGAESDIQRYDQAITEIIKDKLYTKDVNLNLQQILKTQFNALDLKLSTVESCTGGLIASLLTKEAGVSSFYEGGAVAYSNLFKEKQLQVSPETLNKFGAVSEECVQELALNANKLYATDIALSISGIAGPDGGSEAKPVGTVCIGLAYKDSVKSYTIRFNGKRNVIQQRCAQYSFYLIWMKLKEIAGN